MLPANIDAVSCGLGLVHADTQYVRDTRDLQTAALDRQETRLDRQATRLRRHGELLAEILRRLPEPPART